jgi:hypothetical protein
MTNPTTGDIARREELATDCCSRETQYRTRRERVSVVLALLACGGLAACHKTLTAGRTGSGGNVGASAGGAVGSGGTYAGASGWRLDGGMGSGGTLDETGGTTAAATGSGGFRTRPTGRGGAGADAAGTGGVTSAWDGAMGEAAGATPIPEPVDDRPPRPEWSSPFTTPLGVPGWQESTQPLCDANQGAFALGAFDVWADHRGVFVLVGAGCQPGFGVQCGKDGTSVKLNAGTGWQHLYQFAPGSTQSPRLWPSVPDGPLLVTGPLDGYGPGAAFLDNGVFGFQPTDNLYGAWGGFAVGPDLTAYVIDEGKLRKYSAGVWSTVGDLGDQLPLLAIWAGPEGAIVAGYNQTIATQAGNGPLTFMSGVPVGEYRAVWAFGPSDVWFGNRANQLLHYDGKKWQAHATGSKSTDGIKSLWGAAGNVYFTTRSEFGRWNGSQVEILLQAAGDTDLFGTIWGRSVDEVFVAIRDWRYNDNACGAAFILWFDGARFHQF